jgi:hypothetical protein
VPHRSHRILGLGPQDVGNALTRALLRGAK